ncbi:MAG: hypothetical protein ACJAZO_000506 [Myxococcota bacterium]|jgi:hypothetical protein
MADGWDEAEDWEVDPVEMARLERDGAFAVILGVLGMTSAMFVYPSYGVMSLPTIVLGIVAAYLGKTTVDSGVQGAPRAYGIIAMVTGIVSSVWAAIVLCFCATAITLYVGFILLMIAAIGGGQ